MRSHDWIDQRSLALHEAVAKKLVQHPALLEVARENLRLWLAHDPRPALLEWQQLIETLPFVDLVELLRSPDPSATRLRQSSPFAGVLTPQERQAILNHYESHPA